MLRQLTVGESVYTCRYNGYGITYQAAKVVKVTPSGMFDVTFGSNTHTVRFNVNGHEVGADKFRRYEIDQNETFERRSELIAQDNRKRNAAATLKNIKPADVNVMYADKESLLKELARMRTDLDAAQALVDAI